PNTVVNTWNGNSPTLAMKLGDHLAQGLQRIMSHSAEVARVQIVLRTLHFQFQRQRASFCVADGRPAGAEHLRIRHNGGGRRQPLPISFQEGQQVGTAYLFLALKKALHIDRQRGLSPEKRLQRLYMREHLSLVVARSSGEQILTPNGRLKRWR